MVGRGFGRSGDRSVGRPTASSGSNDDGDDGGSGWTCQSAGLRQNERKARLTGGPRQRGIADSARELRVIDPFAKLYSATTLLSAHGTRSTRLARCAYMRT